MENFNHKEKPRKVSNEELETLAQSCYLRANFNSPLRRVAPKMKRNDICPLDPYKKFKNCCGKEGKNHCKEMLLNYLKSINIKG